MIIERLLQLIKYKGINKRKFYIETGLSNGFLDKVKDIGASKIEQILITYPDINPEWLLTGNGEMTNHVLFPDDQTNSGINWFEEPAAIYRSIVKKQSIPLYNTQSSNGISSLFDDPDQKPVDYISVPNLPKCDGAICVSGDSMYPLLKSGDTIIYRKMNNSVNNIFWGEMYLVSFINDDDDEFLLIKWIQKSEKGENWIKLVSENSLHQPKDIHINTVKGLALIKASLRIISTY
jgi:phage repressor protein C with HTH and peptisase S24 domain